MSKMSGKGRVLVIGLDGFDGSVGETFMAQGKLENLRFLKEQSARYLLDHGTDKYTGLAGEHFSSGLSPRTSGFWSPIHFDPKTYRVVQKGTVLDPFVRHMSARSVVFDPIYFDLEKTPQTNGIVAWGAHGPGIPQTSRPESLRLEILERFGSYKATDCVYGFTWPSVKKTVSVGRKLSQAVDQRAKVAEWLFSERLPDWDLAILVVSEVHSVLEPMWHGLDSSHPLHHLPSARPAAAAVEEVYKAVDRLIGTMMASFPEATVITFAMHGMGPNDSDVPSMLLLPEFLYRRHFPDCFFDPSPEWCGEKQEVVRLRENQEWEKVIRERLNYRDSEPTSSGSRFWRFLNPWRKKPLKKSIRPETTLNSGVLELPVDWMPMMQYSSFWPRMKAFALPAFADGRIRVNLAGREKHGIVQEEDYGEYCQELETALRECRDFQTGESVIQDVARPGGRNPCSLGPTEADLVVRWRGIPTGMSHPTVGEIGPAPLRRTGGHTGTYGFAYLRGGSLAPGDYGVRSSYDVVPTLFDLMGEPVPSRIAGQSLMKGMEGSPS